MKLFYVAIATFFLSISLNAQQGTLRGSMYDKETGEALLYANILVNETGGGTTTDLDGAYTLDMDPGIYTMTYSYVGYADYVVEGVEIIAGEVTILDAILGVEGELLNEVVVTATQTRNSVAALATLKRKSTNMIDGISSASFKKIGDSNAASAVKRVPGVSIEGGKYVYVRGLGDRYTKSILNGVDIPGLDPDRNTLQMDIFPTNILDNIIVKKTFTADLPADFTGGIVDITTKDFPEDKILKVSAGIGYNPSMHFNDNYVSYQGGATDFLGFDDGTREIPTAGVADIPFVTDALSDPNGAGVQYGNILRGFNSTMGAMRSTSFMDYNFGLSSGNQYKIGGYSLGYNVVLTYKNDTEFYEDAIYSRYGKGRTSDILPLDLREEQIGDVGKNTVLLGGLAGLALKTAKSKYSINLLHLQNGESTSGVFNYVGADQGANFTADQYNLEYSQRAITNVLFSGKHSINSGDMEIEWKVAPTRSRITDPDIRFLRFRTDSGDPSIGTESGLPARIWRFLEEDDLATRLDFTNNYSFRDKDAKLKYGLGATLKDRYYEIQGFSFNTGTIDLDGNPDGVFAEENYFGTDNFNGLIYTPTFTTASGDPNFNKFDSQVYNYAAYLSTELELVSNLKAVIGLRGEYYNQQYTGVNQDRVIFDKVDVLDDLDLFPTANFIYALTDNQNFRVSYARTIARPSFKEASFATIIDPISGRTFIGGFFPDVNVSTGEEVWSGQLSKTDINNFDIRWESFQEGGQNLSLSTFYKTFKNPIEIVQYLQATNNFQPRNVGDGQVLGIELELRQNLDKLISSFKNISFNLNTTFVHSQIKMSETEFISRQENARDGEEIKDTRRMAGQAPYLINAGFAYNNLDSGLDFGIFYNVQGETLQFVGIADRPDVFTVPFHSLNVSANKTFGADRRLSIGVKGENLLGSRRESEFQSFGADNKLFQSLAPQRSISLSIGYDLR